MSSLNTQSSSSSPPQQSSLNTNSNTLPNTSSLITLQQTPSMSSISYYASPLNSPQAQHQLLTSPNNNNNTTTTNLISQQHQQPFQSSLNNNNNNLISPLNTSIHNNNLNSNLDNFDVIGFSEEELKSIDQTFSIGAMNAFGMKQSENEILNLIDQISTLQVRSFLGSMEIELKHQNLLNNNNFDNFQSVSQLFQEKEKSISNLVKDLKIITRSINDINQKIHQSNNNNNN